MATTASPATAATTTTTTRAPSTTTTTTTTTTAPPTTATRLIAAFEPVDVVFTLTMEAGAIGSSGTFIAAGAAVDDGPMCPEGTCYVIDSRTILTCDDGSGRFKIDTDGENEEGSWVEGHWITSGTWWIAEGEDSYVGMSGDGSRTGDMYAPEDLREYSGKLWRDM